MRETICLRDNDSQWEYPVDRRSIWHTTSGLSSKERKRGLNKLGLGTLEDAPVTAVWHHPKGCSEDGAVHFDRIEEVAVPVQDESCGRNPGQRRRREIHVVIAVLHPTLPLPQRDHLLVAKLMAFAHGLPFCRCLVFPNLPHDRPGLLREIPGRANQNHRLNTIGLQRRCGEGHTAGA
jgi:hypothetical protein